MPLIFHDNFNTLFYEVLNKHLLLCFNIVNKSFIINLYDQNLWKIIFSYREIKGALLP